MAPLWRGRFAFRPISFIDSATTIVSARKDADNQRCNITTADRGLNSLVVADSESQVGTGHGGPVPTGFPGKPPHCLAFVYDQNLQGTHCRRAPSFTGRWQSLRATDGGDYGQVRTISPG
jgi:hypothetical protein